MPTIKQLDEAYEDLQQIKEYHQIYITFPLPRWVNGAYTLTDAQKEEVKHKLHEFETNPRKRMPGMKQSAIEKDKQDLIAAYKTLVADWDPVKSPEKPKPKSVSAGSPKYSEKKRDDLYKLVKQRGITGCSKMKKAELIDVLKRNDKKK